MRDAAAGCLAHINHAAGGTDFRLAQFLVVLIERDGVAGRELPPDPGERYSGTLMPHLRGMQKIRANKGYWGQIESYMSTHLDVRFSHGYCPQSLRIDFPGIDDED